LSDYHAFVAQKSFRDVAHGFAADNLPDALFPFQRDIVRWACERGRAAIFADTGLGKTAMQLSWAHAVATHTNANVLVLAPLCVAHQTVREGEKFGIPIHYGRQQSDVRPGVNITNYEMMDRFDLESFSGIVLDESSILKSHDGKTRNALITACQFVPYRLSCTATPSPNDHMELGNQSEFLGIMGMTEMLAMFFTHDGSDTSQWRLKGHGKAKFWEWLATWAVVIRSPADLGYDASAYQLPGLDIHNHVVESDVPEGHLFVAPAAGLLERNRARRESVGGRVERISEIVNESSEQWIVWCHLNDESDLLESKIDGANAVKGADSIDQKEAALDAFTEGSLRVLVTKPSIAGFGMNWQHCSHMAFVGLSDSWEQYYQAIRRCYRYGQKKRVQVHIVSAETEGAVVENIKRKQAQADELGAQMVGHMRDLMQKSVLKAQSEKTIYRPTKIMEVPSWVRPH
jgi:superfamily II DNA or RNA helicase